MSATDDAARRLLESLRSEGRLRIEGDRISVQDSSGNWQQVQSDVPTVEREQIYLSRRTHPQTSVRTKFGVAFVVAIRKDMAEYLGPPFVSIEITEYRLFYQESGRRAKLISSARAFWFTGPQNRTFYESREVFLHLVDRNTAVIEWQLFFGNRLLPLFGQSYGAEHRRFLVRNGAVQALPLYTIDPVPLNNLSLNPNLTVGMPNNRQLATPYKIYFLNTVISFLDENSFSLPDSSPRGVPIPAAYFGRVADWQLSNPQIPYINPPAGSYWRSPNFLVETIYRSKSFIPAIKTGGVSYPLGVGTTVRKSSAITEVYPRTETDDGSNFAATFGFGLSSTNSPIFEVWQVDYEKVDANLYDQGITLQNWIPAFNARKVGTTTVSLKDEDLLASANIPDDDITDLIQLRTLKVGVF